MKLCFFGGTFDPPHVGHENLINELLPQFDKIVVMPSKQSPGKDYSPFAEKTKRLKMLKLCDFSNNPKCIISDYELRLNNEKNYTVDTMLYLKNEFKKYEIYMAIGLDQLNVLNTWHKPEELIKIVKIICFNRYNFKLKDKLSIDYEFIEDFNYNISSSDIRDSIPNNIEGIKIMLNEKVLNYIIKEGLYQ